MNAKDTDKAMIFKKADELRKKIEKMGFEIEDTEGGARISEQKLKCGKSDFPHFILGLSTGSCGRPVN